jgi:hypothetical protein
MANLIYDKETLKYRYAVIASDKRERGNLGLIPLPGRASRIDTKGVLLIFQKV